MWTDDRTKYYCPDCQKSFSVDSEEVRFSPDLVNAIAGQVAGQLTPMIEKVLKEKLKPAREKKPPHDEAGPGKAIDGPVSKKKEHKWDP